MLHSGVFSALFPSTSSPSPGGGSAWPSIAVVPLSPFALAGFAVVMALLALISPLPTRVRLSLSRRVGRAVCLVCDALAWQVHGVLALLQPWTWLSGASHPHPVYLVELTTFSAPPDWRCSTARFRRIAGHNFGLPQETVDFCTRVIERSGLGQHTAFPRQRETQRTVPPHIAAAACALMQLRLLL